MTRATIVFLLVLGLTSCAALAPGPAPSLTKKASPSIRSRRRLLTNYPTSYPTSSSNSAGDSPTFHQLVSLTPMARTSVAIARTMSMVMIPLGGDNARAHAAAAPPVTDRGVDRAMLTACVVVTCLLPSPRERRWRRGGGDQQEEGPWRKNWRLEPLNELFNKWKTD